MRIRANTLMPWSFLAAAAIAMPIGLSAQTRPAPPAAPRDTVARPAVRDTARAATGTRGPRRARAGAAPRPNLQPPITPRRAFLSSLILPGLGQSRLGRPTAGAVFAGFELASVIMISKSLADLRSAKAFRADSVPLTMVVDSAGVPTGATTLAPAPYTNDLVRARRLHLEDWLAAILFNHLISGAEAYVSANLFDLPAQISARPTARGGGAVAVSLAW